LVELSSDDGTTDVHVDQTQHLTAGLVFPSGSHLNLRAVSGNDISVELVGYQVKAD